MIISSAAAAANYCITVQAMNLWCQKYRPCYNVETYMTFDINTWNSSVNIAQGFIKNQSRLSYSIIMKAFDTLKSLDLFINQTVN